MFSTFKMADFNLVFVTKLNSTKLADCKNYYVSGQIWLMGSSVQYLQYFFEIPDGSHHHLEFCSHHIVENE